MNDSYLYENSSVLKNLLGITDENELDIAEAELSRANMMLLYENGFSDFSSNVVTELIPEIVAAFSSLVICVKSCFVKYLNTFLGSILGISNINYNKLSALREETSDGRGDDEDEE